MKKLIMSLLVTVSHVGLPTASFANPLEDVSVISLAVVKVTAHASSPNLRSPWQKHEVATNVGAGVILESGFVLTNAHVIEDAVSIEVERAGTSLQSPATVAWVTHEADLALIKVDDVKFFDGSGHLALGDMPGLQSQVQVYGFPIGGENMAVTSGIVSRVDVHEYVHSFERLLIAQIDAPMNSGNSGGPVVGNGELVGLAVQMNGNAQSVGYMVPALVIRHFLNDIADGRYDGFPRLGIFSQSLEGHAHRVSLGMAENQSGVLVTRVGYGSAADGVIQPGDVILSIDEFVVANDKTVNWPGVGKVALSEAFKEKQSGDIARLKILRNGNVTQHEIRLKPHQLLVPGRRTEQQPQYLVFAGLVFQPLTLEYLESAHRDNYPANLAGYALHNNVVTRERRQVVLIQTVLPHPVNSGYQKWEDVVVRSVDGVTVRDMHHLAQLIDVARGPWLRIVTDDDQVAVLDLEKARAAGPEILALFGIARPRFIPESVAGMR